MRARKNFKLKAMTLIEVIISLALISIAFLSMFQALNYIYRANMYIDDRIAVRDQAAFFTRYVALRLENGKPTTFDCTTHTSGNREVVLSWDAVGGSTKYRLVRETSIDHPYLDKTYNRLVFEESHDEGTTYHRIVLTYPTVNVKGVEVDCAPEPFHDKVTLLDYFPISIVFTLESTRERSPGVPSVSEVKKYTSVLVVN